MSKPEPAAVPEPGPVACEAVDGLRESSLELEVREYLTTEAVIKAFQLEQEARRLVVLRLLQDAGVKSVIAGPGIASVVKGRETIKIDRKKLLTLVGPDVVAKVTSKTIGEPSVRIVPIKATETQEEQE